MRGGLTFNQERQLLEALAEGKKVLVCRRDGNYIARVESGRVVYEKTEPSAPEFKSLASDEWMRLWGTEP